MQNVQLNNPLHRFPDSTAQILATSITLETAGHDRTENNTMMLYSEGVVWGNLTGSVASEVANLLGRFVIGAVAVMDISNTKETGAGDTVGVGVRLVIDWFEVGIVGLR
ncbi:hypothetical protein BDD12DRAFT_920351 [Trichophaea hybrida]|nr:hypothetical protein BDD12DRAFT_920351 [Trichophaea hybrida]